MPLLNPNAGNYRGFPFALWPGGGLLVMSALLALAGSADLHPQSPPAGEYEIKAAFLYNFTKFVEWPPAGFPDAGSPFVIGILGDDPFGSALDATVAGKQVVGRSVAIRRWKKPGEIENCQILFISGSDPGVVPAVVEHFRSVPILTVSDTEQFSERGGMIQLSLAEHKIRFEVNHRAAREAGLKISSRLLTLAVRVWE
jgi:hypothetical protein